MNTRILILESAEGICRDFNRLKGSLASEEVRTAVLTRDRAAAFPAAFDPQIVLMHSQSAGVGCAAEAAIASRYASAVFVKVPCGSGETVCGSAAAKDRIASLLRFEDPRATKPLQLLPGIIGCSPILRKAISQVAPIAESDATCLLQGETGTGKELFARAIHYSSERRQRPFVPVNCGAIPESLFENELFGHARGAYTDAGSDERGLLAYAENGTLFLDEIDSLSLAAQVKLLRVLQEREYRPVGSAKSIRTGVRVIAATNSDLRTRVRNQQFREDLFHRLNVLRLTVPALRERGEDIPLLVKHFTWEFAGRYNRPVPVIPDEVLARLVNHPWPGNVRELEGVLERAVLIAKNGVMAAEDLDLPEAASGTSCIQTLKAAKDRAITHFEQSYLADVLTRCAGNVSSAARAAGKERRAFQRLLRKYHIESSEYRVT